MSEWFKEPDCKSGGSVQRWFKSSPAHYLFFRFQCARILWNKTVAFMDVVIYTKDNCSYCEKIKSVFKLKDINFVEYKLEKDFTREQFINEFGEGSTFPRVSIDGNLIGGASETVNYLRERGIL